jgi:hypothetical protein
VWDARTRALRAAGAPLPSDAPEAPSAPQELGALIGTIVGLTLDARLPECAPERRAELQRELEARLTALFAAPPADAAPAGTEPEDLAPEALPSGSEPPADPLERALAALGGPLAARPDLRLRLLELVTAARAPAAPSPDGASRTELSELDLLRRRAAKLERSLADARAALAYVAGLERVEEGLASIYRTVQGLGAADPLRARKREALEGVFRANLALQKRAES